MSSAQLDTHPEDELAPLSAAPLPPFELTQSGLKQQVADRVAAHRARRSQIAPDAVPTGSTPPARSRTSRVRSANIAAVVAERYAQSPTYRAFLASEAERAVHQAHATAKIATINAEAIAVAQQQLLADLENWNTPPGTASGPFAVSDPQRHVPLSPVDYAALFDREPVPAAPATPPVARTSISASNFTIRPYADAAHSLPAHRHATENRFHAGPFGREFDEDERLSLDDEIAFRHNPVFEELSPQEAIAANLIEFPRQLVAARKARPRIAEGPLRDDEQTVGSAPQLRIFEVEPDHISSEPSSEEMAPEWASILLSALPTADFAGAADPDYLAANIPQAAPIRLRLMSAVVDFCLIFTVQVAFTAVFALALTRLAGENAVLEIPRAVAVAGTACTLAVLALLYQLLFFTLSDATPGMRYARIGLCTLSNENPTRSAMRRRIFATLLAVFPLGLGLIWAFLDEDTLGWHDRISRMYQRSY